MLIADIKTLPKIGEIVVMENAIHGEIESLKAVAYMNDDEDKSTIHVLFASEDPKDNIHEEDGIRYYCIMAYAQI
jgi:hypothetical protein